MIENNMRNNLKDVYREALILHKISWQKREKKKYFWQKSTFDDSHLPEFYDNPDYWDAINRKLDSFVKYSNCKDGKFIASLTFNECLILLLKPNVDNINYKQTYDIDLENYELCANTFKIEVI
jgi:hypothetical protein